MRRTTEERLIEAREAAEDLKRAWRAEVARICLPLVVRLDRLLSYRKRSR